MIRQQLVLAFGALITATAALAHEPPRPRLLAVGGEGEVRVAPDRADVRFAVEASERTLADAERIVGEGVARLLRLTEELGIARNQVRSSQLQVHPQYDHGGVVSKRPKIVGYHVSRQVEVDLSDLSKLGRLLQGAVESGANQVSAPAFGSTKKDEHERAALALAAEDARANAQLLARTLGVKLGALHSLAASAGGGAPPQPMMMARMKAEAAGDLAQTYEVGEIRFSASVNAEFELEK
jgi:uncharacterized protein